MSRKLVGFGASTMQGVGDSQGGFLSRVAGQGGTTYRVINAGVGGNTTRDMLERVPAVLEHRPFDLIVLLGCNDLPRARDPFPENRVSVEEYTANLTRLLSDLKAERSLFVSSFLPSETLTGVAAETFEIYMGEALRLARELRYEIWDLFRETYENGADFHAADGMHFNDAGHAFIAERVSQWLTGEWATA